MKLHMLWWAGGVLGLAAAAAGSGAGQNAPSPAWPFRMSYDSVAAAPLNHKLLYEDNKVRLIEVTIRPGEKENMHGHPYPSVFGFDAALPTSVGQMKDTPLDPASPLNGQGAGFGPAPKGAQYPTCMTMEPQAPHQVENHVDFPMHFYRIEFKRIDGNGLAGNWKAWYPWMLVPLKAVKDLSPGPELGPPFSREFPFPITYDSIKAAPNNHYLRYQDAKIRLIEVVMRPGETENMHGHPYPSVFAFDVAMPTDPAKAKDRPLDPTSRLNGQDAGQGPAPKGTQFPSCMTMGPQAPHAATNLDSVPVHFYRLEFKRIDGEGIKTHWKDWYPWIVPSHAQQ